MPRRDLLPIRSDQVPVATWMERPSRVAIDDPAERLPARSMATGGAVFKFRAGPRRRFHEEPDLNFAGVALVGPELPLRADIPAEHDPIGWLVREDAGPSALASSGTVGHR